MYPTEGSESRKDVDQFLSLWSGVVDDYYKILTAITEAAATSQLITFLESLEQLESIMASASSKEGPFLLGDTFSVAECIAAPWVQRFFVTLPYFRGIDFEEIVQTDIDCPRVVAWMDAVRARPSVIKTACPEEEMWAAAERYYVSYISPGAPGGR